MSKFSDALAAKADISKALAADLERAVVALIREQVWNNGETLRISGLGAFSVKDVPERKARNPRTGETIIVPAHKRLAFKPATDLRRG